MRILLTTIMLIAPALADARTPAPLRSDVPSRLQPSGPVRLQPNAPSRLRPNVPYTPRTILSGGDYLEVVCIGDAGNSVETDRATTSGRIDRYGPRRGGGMAATTGQTAPSTIRAMVRELDRAGFATYVAPRADRAPPPNSTRCALTEATAGTVKRVELRNNGTGDPRLAVYVAVANELRALAGEVASLPRPGQPGNGPRPRPGADAADAELNPQPLPPRDPRLAPASRWQGQRDRVMLNPQPLPPRSRR